MRRRRCVRATGTEVARASAGAAARWPRLSRETAPPRLPVPWPRRRRALLRVLVACCVFSFWADRGFTSQASNKSALHDSNGHVTVVEAIKETARSGVASRSWRRGRRSPFCDRRASRAQMSPRSYLSSPLDHALPLCWPRFSAPLFSPHNSSLPVLSLPTLTFLTGCY